MGVKLGLRHCRGRKTAGVRDQSAGPKKDEINGGLRKLHNEELQNMCSSPNIIRMIKSRRMKLARHVARKREKRNAYRILVGKLERKRSLGRPRRRWEDIIIMCIREIAWDVMDWIDETQDWDQWRALVNAVMNLQVP
jgi:hypothetical protein